MSDEAHWIASVITKARAQNAMVPDGVLTQIESLLKGKFTQRPIPPVELANVARQLIECMVPVPPKAEERQ